MVDHSSFGTEVTTMMSNLTLRDDTSIIWTDDLKLDYYDANFKLMDIPAYEIHAQLKSTCNILKDKIRSNLSASSLDDDDDPRANFVAANIGFLLSKPDKYGETFVSLPIEVIDNFYYSVRNSWFNDEGIGDDQFIWGSIIRSSSSANRIQQRHDAGWRHTLQAVDFTETQTNGPNHYKNTRSRTYEENFHHSEQALFEYLCRQPSVEDLIKKLTLTLIRTDQDVKMYDVKSGYKNLAIVLDMHSTRYICKNCELALQGMMNPEYIFLKFMTSELHRHGFQYNSQEAGLIPRISANKPGGNKKKKRTQDPNKFGENKEKKTTQDHSSIRSLRVVGHRRDAIKNKSIYQADIATYITPEVNTDLRQRTIFTSSNVTDERIYIKILKHHLEKEYTLMLFAAKIQGINCLAREEQLEYIFPMSHADAGQQWNAFMHWNEMHKAHFSEEDILKSSSDAALKIVDARFNLTGIDLAVKRLIDIGISYYKIKELNEEQREACCTPEVLELLKILLRP